MPSQSGLPAQVERLDSAVRGMEKLEAYPLWVRLVGVLESMGTEIAEITLAVRGNGNGTHGMLQRMAKVESKLESVQTDVHDIKMLISNAPEYSESAHPKRRSVDQETTVADRFLRYLVDKIIPPIIVWAILGFIALQVALNQHLIQVVPTP